MQLDQASLPSPQPVLDLLNGFRRSKVLFTLVSMGVPEVLHSAGSALSLRALAEGLTPVPSMDGLQRLCDAAMSLGLLEGSGAAGYALTPLSQAYLVHSAEYSMAGYIVHSEKLLYPMWGPLDAAVAEGGNNWQRVWGRDSSQVFPALYSDPAALLRFMGGMHSFARLSAAAVLGAFDLAGRRRLVDMGGATGALAIAACERHPELHATVVDLPHVIGAAQAHFTGPAHVRDPSLLGRLSWVAADFFDPQAQVPEGDLFILSRILHDWDDERCRALLRLVHSRLVPGGALLICELLVDESGTGPADTLLQSLNMLVQTHGRERRLSEFRALLEAAGFTNVQGKQTGTPLDATIAFKP